MNDIQQAARLAAFCIVNVRLDIDHLLNQVPSRLFSTCTEAAEQRLPRTSVLELLYTSEPFTNSDSAYVYHMPDGPIAQRNPENFGQVASRHFCQARRDSEIDRELTFHDLRAGFATVLADAGKSAHVIREAMRHSSLKMALKYVRVSRQRLHSEMESAFD
ncbi:tyrosine-type recombinase/integrase [Salinibacter sp.]|uniref:tyrosine-type recombinase/integrase n=1 Tax=Salinibacter sp. TaxID=2065818 RepID=UPI0021E9171C|nr:site-specific integrase [Salinibacter sp.]